MDITPAVISGMISAATMPCRMWVESLVQEADTRSLGEHKHMPYSGTRPQHSTGAQHWHCPQAPLNDCRNTHQTIASLSGEDRSHQQYPAHSMSETGEQQPQLGALQNCGPAA